MPVGFLTDEPFARRGHRHATCRIARMLRFRYECQRDSPTTQARAQQARRCDPSPGRCRRRREASRSTSRKQEPATSNNVRGGSEAHCGSDAQALGSGKEIGQEKAVASEGAAGSLIPCTFSRSTRKYVREAVPLSRFPGGESRGGREDPHAAKRRRLPLQEGFQSASLKTPLLSPGANRAL